jgi:hypothetical protein
MNFILKFERNFAMAEGKSHKTTAIRLAEKFKAEYNPGKGADIITKRIAIEVETPGTVAQGLQQLRGHQKSVYIAGTNQEAVDLALELTHGTTVGVMDNIGNIVKRSTRKRK